MDQEILLVQKVLVVLWLLGFQSLHLGLLALEDLLNRVGQDLLAIL